MRVLCVAAVLVTWLAAGVSASRRGLSWCSESSVDNMPVTKSQKPELGQIEVFVNNSYELGMVDEVWIRQQASCEGITQPEVVYLDGRAARLGLQNNGEISLFWRPPDTLPLFQEVDEFCITASRDSPEGPWTTFLAKFCYPNALFETDKDVHFCSEITCVRKCCPRGQAMARGSSCAAVEEGDSWHPSIASGEPGAAATSVHMLYGPPRNCENALLYDQFSILPSGMVKQGETSVNVDGYCIDTFEGRPNESVAMVGIEREFDDSDALTQVMVSVINYTQLVWDMPQTVTVFVPKLTRLSPYPTGVSGEGVCVALRVEILSAEAGAAGRVVPVSGAHLASVHVRGQAAFY